jgi:fibronectin type 3 domain-containing protein
VPTVPTGVSTVSSSGGAINLSWTASSNAASYNVKRATVSSGPYTTIASIVNATYTDSGLNASTTYYYVVSVASPGYESTNSQEVSAMVGMFAGNQDIGAVGLAGSSTYDGSQCHVPDCRWFL